MNNPITIGGLDHVVLRTSNEAAMLAFYCTALGCIEVRRIASLGVVQLKAGDAMIDLAPHPAPSVDVNRAQSAIDGRNLEHFCLRLEAFDLPAIRAHLQALGVQIGEYGSRVGARGEGPSLYVFDPENNVVELKGPPGPA